MPPADAEILPLNYKLLQEHVYSHTGIVLEHDKAYLFQSRLGPIVKEHGLESINDLCALLRATRQDDLGLRVVEAMTTNETYFYRDPAQYEAIRTTLLPRLKKERADTRTLRFWSAAASTGQEAYSLAMLLLDNGFEGWNVRILGTDFSSQVLERARAGVFSRTEVNRGLPTPTLNKHFRPSGLDWSLSEAVLRMAAFEQFDLRKSMSAHGPFDLVFCRNVMIYFDAETKRSILKEIHKTLFRGGWLLVGGAETLFGVEEWFDKQVIEGVTVHIAR